MYVHAYKPNMYSSKYVGICCYIYTYIPDDDSIEDVDCEKEKKINIK